MPAAGGHGASLRKTLPDSRNAGTCDQHKLEYPTGCSKLCLEFFQVLISRKCSLGLLFSLFICDEHKLETKIH